MSSAAPKKSQTTDPVSAPVDAWPRDASRDPIYTIGALVKIIKEEFPATTVSKVRFLEEKGLVTPQRNASGYRKFSTADLERIRFILKQQRDSYAPLRVIGETLAALDAGHDAVSEPRARIVTSDGQTVTPSNSVAVTVRELADLTGSSREELESYVKSGLISPDLGGRFSSNTVPIVQSLKALTALGVPLRLLRSVRLGAERNADIIEQIIGSGRRLDRPGDIERARADAAELSHMFQVLHQEYLHGALEDLQGE